MSDKNLISFAGDGTGVVWLKRGEAPAELLFTADQPGMREHRIGDLKAQAGQDIADVLKLSGVTRLHVIADSIDAKFAGEDAIDINHCRDCEVLVSDLWAAKKYCGTIKGQSVGIRVVVGRQHTHGGETDWDLGNFSDQGNGRTTGVRLHVNTSDSTPVRVRVLSADVPVLENESRNYTAPQGYKITRLNQGWFYPVYNFLKDLLAFFRVKI